MNAKNISLNLRNTYANHRFEVVLGICIFVFLIFILSFSNQFFWDAITTLSIPAHFFYENNFSKFVYPIEFDNGDPFFLPLFFASVWKIFGHSMLAAKLAIAFFIPFLIFQVYRLANHFLPAKQAALAMLLVFCDPTVLSNATLVCADFFLMLTTLWSLNSMLRNQNKNFSCALFVLCMISRRGMLLGGAIAALYILNFVWKNRKSIKGNLFFKYLFPIIPATILVIAFITFRMQTAGWVYANEHSQWAGLSQTATATDVAKNILIFGWRMVDFGRIFIFIPLLYLMYKYRLKIKNDLNFQILFSLILAFTFLFAVVCLPFKNSFGHRYFIPIYICIEILFAYMLFQNVSFPKAKNIFLLFAGLLFLGNSWIYPDRISQGWDSTLAHLPYFSTRTAMIQFIDEQDIPMAETASFFPANSEFKYTDVSNDDRSFQEFNPEKSKYVLTSNVFNLPDETFNIICREYNFMYKYQNFGVWMCLYQRKDLQ